MYGELAFGWDPTLTHKHADVILECTIYGDFGPKHAEHASVDRVVIVIILNCHHILYFVKTILKSLKLPNLYRCSPKAWNEKMAREMSPPRLSLSPASDHVPHHGQGEEGEGGPGDRAALSSQLLIV